MVASVCYICKLSDNQLLVRQCDGRQTIQMSSWSKSAPEKFESRATVRIQLLEVNRNFSPIGTPDRRDMTTKDGLVFEYELKNGAARSSVFDDLTAAPEKNFFGLRIDRSSVVNQTVALLRRFHSGKGRVTTDAHHLSTMAKYFRVLNLEDLQQIERSVLPQNSPLGDSPMKSLFYDLLSKCGSNPAALMVKQSVETGLVIGQTAAKVVSEMFRSIQTPTLGLLKDLAAFVKTLKHLESDSKDLHHIGLVELSRLFRRACVDPESSRKQFPVEFFGPFCSPGTTFQLLLGLKKLFYPHSPISLLKYPCFGPHMTLLGFYLDSSLFYLLCDKYSR